MISVGQMVGNYRVTRLIGRGGMGFVFEAIHTAIGRRAAIKVLLPELCTDPVLATRFLNEARAVNLVRHPGLVEIFEFGNLSDGSAFIIMDYLDGESLASAIARQEGHFPRGTALDIVRQVAAALAAAHNFGIVHRDLKPENIMLVADVERPGHLRVKVLDFGIAKLASDPSSTAIHTGTLPGLAMGTPAYMAPEQCLGTGKVDAQADVYSLGILFYEMLAGKRPFAAQLAMDLMNLHLRASPPPLRATGVADAIVKLLEDMLAKSPAERPTMRGVVAALAPFVAAQGERGLHIQERPLSAAAQLLPTLESDSMQSAADEQDPFIAGPPITDPQHFYGRQREIKRLFGLWRRPPLQNAAIIGPARSGKTSLLHYLRNILTANSLRTEQRLDLVSDPSRYRFLFVDFQDPRMGTQEGLLRHILLGLGLPVPTPCDLEQFIAVMSALIRSPTILLFDEVSVALQRYKELDMTFWEGLRALAINQVSGNLGFVLASAYPPHILAQQHEGGGSPFFNIFGYSATLGPLNEADARQLIRMSPMPFPESDVLWILEQSHGWPMLLQILARERLQSLRDQDQGDEWKDAAMGQMLPFRHLLQNAGAATK